MARFFTAADDELEEFEVREQNSTKGMVAAIIANTIFGLSFIFSKIALTYTEPSMMLVLRFGIAFLVMSTIALVRKGCLSLRGKPILPLLALGLCNPLIYFICESYGIKYTNASFSGIMIALIPMVSTVFSVIFLKEELKKSKIKWILLALLGVIIITVTQSTGGSIQLKGVMFMVIAVISASAFTILSASLANQFTSFERTYIMMMVGMMAFFVMALLQLGGNFKPAFLSAVSNGKVLGAIVFLAVICSIVGFFCNNVAVTELSVQRATAFANLSPVISVVAGVLVLGENFSILYLVGILMILLAIYRMNREA